MNYSEIFNSLTSQKILIIGDVMLDSYVWGTVERISPEAPVPVVHVSYTENRLGGAANVAKNIHALGLKPILCSVIGDDEAGKNLCAVLHQRGISADCCFVSSQRVTTVKTRVMSGNHQMLRVDNERIEPLSKQDNAQLRTHIFDVIEQQKIAAIVLQDYDKGVLTADTISSIVSAARKHSIPVVVDPKKNNFADYNNVQLFKPNFKEFCDGTQSMCEKTDLDTLYVLAKKYMTEHSIERVMITLSEHGVFIANRDEYVHIPSQVRYVSDVSGAGDTVISVAVACLIAGLPDGDLARISNIAAGLACEMPGVVSITKEQLLKLI